MRYENLLAGTLKEFKNGNVNIKFSNESIMDCRQDDNMFQKGFATVFNMLAWFDTYVISDVLVFGNFEGGYILYNVRLDRVYRILTQDIDALIVGETIKLYASVPDEDEREMIEHYGY